jgi:hypothetical protein
LPDVADQLMQAADKGIEVGRQFADLCPNFVFKIKK